MNTTEFKYEIKLTSKHGTETALYESLEGIIHSVIECYCGSDLTGYELNIEDDQFNVFHEFNFIDAYEHVCEQTPSAVARMLDDIAYKHGKEHTYEIIEL
ncbi:TPA: hypothetical protein ACQVKY_005207 [Serratia marcescens]|uniref:Uncharacterized protein n=1 Tax=Serratia nevei TaxID=2703794 RepID=A0ABT7G5H8_9GAMM|nr:hypothetical protein [Serratia nevei]HAU4290843.1 hypothetical protein [Serratia marcescens]MDK5169013.1 hypothetical protein [Serratia nevei]MDK5298507.1 hypothetical protein [Serratia nevei]MEC5887241.1 hypothetical protein [Serratia nevei]HAU4297503.1 hypothetical protein [Serratia marcescens]